LGQIVVNERVLIAIIKSKNFWPISMLVLNEILAALNEGQDWQMVSFQTKNPDFGKFSRALE
jgi:hypothetical protein